MKANTKVIVTTLRVMVLSTIAFLVIPKNVSPPKGNTQYIHEDRIFDENGSEIVWRGAGGSYLFHAGDDYQEAWQRHLPEIQAMGLNTIRLAFKFPWDTSTADVLDYTKLAWIVGFLGKNNIKSILDNHGRTGFGSQNLINSWKELAAQYVGDDRIIAYELFNEPFPGTWDQSVKTKEDAIRVFANLTREIRNIDSNHIHVWPLSEHYFSSLEEASRHFEPNIAFTVHRWWTYVQQEFEFWTPEQLADFTLGYLIQIRERFHVPIWLGEFGAHPPFNSSNPEWLLTEQLLSGLETQAIGWNLWMGRTTLSKPWNRYLNFFPLKITNAFLIRQAWQPPSPKLTDYVINQSNVEFLDLYRIKMWHNGDYVTLRPGIVIFVITNHRLDDGSIEIISQEEIRVKENMRVSNEEGTSRHPGDWNIIVYLRGLA